MNNLLQKITKITSSIKFFYLILVFFALQALWYIFSFQPSVFDEPKHLSKIFIYSHHLSPFLGSQNPAWDYVGDLARDGSYMFFYLMSWPLRIISYFTKSVNVQIVSLRLICLIFVIIGLIVLRKAFVEFKKLPGAFVNIIFLILSLTPSIVLLAGAVNYDNMVFLLFSIALLLGVRIVKRRSVSFIDICLLLSVCLFTTVVKWTAAALFAPIVLYVIYNQLAKFKLQFFRNFFDDIKKIPLVSVVALSVLFFITLGLFIERPVMNTIRYGKPEPACNRVISYQRCLKFHDFYIYSLVDAKKPKDFKPLNPISYTKKYWAPIMLDTEVNILEKGRASTLPVAKYLFETGSIISLLAILIYIPKIIKDKGNMFFLSVAIFYVAVLFITDYTGYIKHGMPAAIRFRYLVPISSIFLYFVAQSIYYYFGKYRKTLLICFICCLLLVSQGGGMITHLMTAPPNLYWQRNIVIKTNTKLKNTIAPLVKQ